MATPAEFEEKEYERYFNDHLSIVDRQCWSPGQVLEGRIGFDGAAMVSPHLLFDLFHFRRLRRHDLQRGVQFDANYVREVFNVLDAELPPYRFNLFAQYKRPEYVSRSNGREWSSWRRRYYRYEINIDQNDVLCKIESICGGASLVTYCCPAFHTKSELWGYNLGGTILEKSNYAPPSRLSGHHVYSFADPGGRGRGHSEEEEIEGKPLKDMLSIAMDRPAQSAKQLTLQAGKAIKSAFAENWRSTFLARQIVSNLVGESASYPEPEDSAAEPIAPQESAVNLVEAVAHIVALRFTFGTSVMLMGADR